MTDAMREKFERDMNLPSIWEELASWQEAFNDYAKDYQAAHEEAKALVGELVSVAVWAKDRARGEAAIDIQGTLTKATKWINNEC